MLIMFGRFLRRPVEEPRIITSAQFLDGDVRVGDLLEVVGGCPRFPGDQCDLIGNHKSIVREYKGELYYTIVS